MAAIATIIGGISIAVLYNTAFQEKQNNLIYMAKSQARLIEAVARFDRNSGVSDTVESAAAARLDQIRMAISNYRGFGETGEFVLGDKIGDEIVFLLEHRHPADDEHSPVTYRKPAPIPFMSNLAEPMRRALSGQSGTLVGLDYQGEKVLAAYEPVSELNFGIVTKIDLQEVRAPYLKAAVIIAGIAVMIVVGGLFLFIRISNLLSRDIQEHDIKRKEIERIKDEFVSTVSHELRTPLTVILGYLPLLKDADKLPEASKISDLASRMEISGKQLLTLVNDLLDYARLTAGQLELDIIKVNLADIISEAASTLEKMANDKGLRFEIETTSCWAEADPERLLQILLNLINNAIKFTSKGAIKLVLHMDQQEGNAVFSVIDTGPGIHQDQQGIVFERFKQADSSISRSAEGAGLGLAISKKLVELHGGNISLESTLGEGTIFTFTIPQAGHEKL